MSVKLFRLIVHQKNFSEEDLLINPKDYPDAKEGDIVEIYHPNEDENPRLLLQIKAFKDDMQTKDTISVEQSIASAFGLRTYKDVSLRLVNPKEVALDSIELTFKDQYMGRSEMWRLKNKLTNTCAYINKKIEFCGGTIRCQVYEMWSMGDRVACGVITNDTKVVFRSSTSMVYLFLQMSSEMWDFDIYGDLYFEKAVNGFLSDLFMKWKRNGSNHEVTIVLFSRTFYKASSLEEFPESMRECLQKDYKGRYYEDFYRVAVQNERYDDWSGILVQLRKVFADYLKFVLEYHNTPDVVIPHATNSTAAQGNFLEVLNMSLNVFEKHYLDRSFDRTGQLSVVVTPGVGVFEVDRELTNITKQRIIDNGVGSDLVCVGEQPLHAVPLLKFHNKDSHLNVPDDYSMPHWINLSFYSTNKKIAYSNFIPRIKVPPIPNNNGHMVENKEQSGLIKKEEDCLHNSFFDYDAYDAQVFQLPGLHDANQRTTKHKKSGLLNNYSHLRNRKLSDPDLHQNDHHKTHTQPIPISPCPSSPVLSPTIEDKTWSNAGDRELSPPFRMVVGSEGSPPLESRALINPFDPSHVTIKLTSNRRRWTHIFPKGPTGVLIQQHHYQATPKHQDRPVINKGTRPADINFPIQNTAPQMHLTDQSIAALHEYCKKRSSVHMPNAPIISVPVKQSKSTLLWGATGEQEWTPALTTVNEVLIGVDWKSLTIPACLPITTDYFPDQKALQTDYVVSLYNLLPDDVNNDYAQKRAIYREPLTTVIVFRELISQRLSQGFQLIVLPNKNKLNTNESIVRTCTKSQENEESETFLLSIGRLFHKISLTGNSITVTRYRPRHPYPGFNYQYRYRFYAPHHDNYEESYASFSTEKLEHYAWNYLDHYICTRGDTDFELVDTLKYWRFRMYLLPLHNNATKRIIEGAEHCDIYELPTKKDHQIMIDGFLKFVETVVNKIKRPGVSKKPRMSLSVITHNLLPSAQPRRNSMSAVMQATSRSIDRSLSIRSGSKVMERGRVSPAVESQISDSLSLDGNEETVVQAEPMLKATATHLEILEAMRNPYTGVGFLTTHQSFANLTFVSADAVNWLIKHVEGISDIETAVKKMNTMKMEGLIGHASGDFTKKFIYGFYLYCIISDKEDKEDSEDKCDVQSFENEWLEVEIKKPLEWGRSSYETANTSNENEFKVPHFLRENIDASYFEDNIDDDTPLYKRIHLEMDISNKSDRVEWGHARYQRIFRPDQAYELVVEWLTSSGAIAAELLFGWYRKAQTCQLQLVPIPHDPLALPYSNKSDPLRGPIFIPLNIGCLSKQGGSRLFKEFNIESYTDRLFLFQEAIVSKFGFIQCLVEQTNNSSTSQEFQYVHCTGTVFILISCPTPRTRNRLTSFTNKKLAGRYSDQTDIVSSPHEAYITRHVSGKNKDDYDNTRRMGFLWSWNHMVGKRWRINQAVDNNFQTKLLKDFREFCANKNNRLVNFWDQCWDAKESATFNSTSIN